MNLAGIWNINSTYNVNNKKISAKLSFEVGEKFSARIMQLNRSTGEILLKLLDGWQFSGQLENFQNILENQLIRLEVEGFEDGKLKLRIVNSGENSNNSSDLISLFIKENDLNFSSEDYDLIDKMVKRDIPLTKDNISNIKSILEFIDKVKQNPAEQDAFIQKYLASKNLSPNSEEGNFVNTTLKNFFGQLKNMTTGDLLTFIENNLELSEDNIKSFNSIFKNQGAIYSEVKTMGQLLPKHIVQESSQFQNLSKSIVNSTADDQMNAVGKNQSVVQLQEASKNVVNSPADEQVNVYGKNQSAVQQGEKDNTGEKVNILKILDHAQKPDSGENAGEKINIKNKSIETLNQGEVNNNAAADSGEKGIGKDSGTILGSFVKDKIMPHISRKDGMLNREDIDQIAGQIKDEINIKTNDMKDIIKGILDQKNNGKNDSSENINYVLNNNINDFKIFNTISNSYYYMDLPINLNQKNYQCKLIIRDERGKGKKIDSTNVKIAASISTENMGVVDAYLSVSNYNMDIDIKCNKKWLGLLDRGREKILESLSDIGYNIDVKFHEKVEDMNISTCREFFQDNEMGIINTRA
ncbi:hypothetical protein [Clostridium luticellarii]|jgi:hypothetical protein|uniref:hypothetical protein n=1 Tax=Clostridium luticellarii TaxID=1691940 RepID=UPI001FA8E3CB|nr:hypothetical protein [Clostridium luticellarii]MCI1944792.1 hypothetical protein [Clostridium luticellarii]MCI1968287.1 hypothetical protein [Clostridium luticellarii]MCI1995676.1 hypothetical protein [Clostridium luticellarii]MCI2040244.1 hypothetical protein [Clostridium luticellarii]